MKLKLLISSLFVSLFFFAFSKPAFAVPVRSYVTILSSSGYYNLRSEQGGNGDVTPGSTVTVDSYLFQCRTHGTAACSTQWNSDATLVNTWHNSLTVPTLNHQTSRVTHTFSLPYGQCGRIQYDQGIVGINGAIGGKVYDFGRDCETPQQNGGSNNGGSTTVNSCSSQLPVNTQFRLSGNGAWVAGSQLAQSGLSVGQNIDVNCFAKNGTALLDGGYIDVRTPNGQTSRVSNTAELHNYRIADAGTYSFTCGSATMNSCTDTDSFTLQTITQRSTCDSLQIVSGNDSLVPARVTLRAKGSDNLGNLQKYRFYFGDGEQAESDTTDVTHEYKSSGSFIAKADIKDSQGNWRSSSLCEATVRVKSSTVESFKSDCSDIFITADNNSKAPSTVKFDVTGYDNKGSIKAYKLDLGTGVVREQDSRHFEEVYRQPGTYTVKAYVKNSQDNWVGGDDFCQRTVTIGSAKPLTRQPSTRTPTAIPVIGFTAGGAALALELMRRKMVWYR